MFQDTAVSASELEDRLGEVQNEMGDGDMDGEPQETQQQSDVKKKP